MKLYKESLIYDHLLQGVNNPSFDEFTILVHGKRKYLLEIKEILLIKRDQPVLNKNISSTPLHLFMTTSLVNFYCDSCNFYSLSRCLFYQNV